MVVLSSCTGTQGNSSSIFFVQDSFIMCVLCVYIRLVFCIGSCVPVHEDRTASEAILIDSEDCSIGKADGINKIME